MTDRKTKTETELIVAGDGGRVVGGRARALHADRRQSAATLSQVWTRLYRRQGGVRGAGARRVQQGL